MEHLAFFVGMLTMAALNQMQKLYFRKHRVRMIAYELLPADTYWFFDFDETERAHYTMRAERIFDKAHGG